MEHSIQDANLTRAGERRIVSKRILYIELDNTGNTRHLHSPFQREPDFDVTSVNYDFAKLLQRREDPI